MNPTDTLDRAAPSPTPAAPRPDGAPAAQRPDSAKSRRTRARILDAAMRLLADQGYAGASNGAIADAAQLTRGAMLYHFPTREALVEAVIDHIQRLRIDLFQRAAAEKPSEVDAAEYAIDSYWRLLREPPFVAFAELEGAARADPWLAEAIRPAQEAFDRAQMGEGPANLLLAGMGARFQASRDLARFALEGLARATLADEGDERVARLLEIIKRATHVLNRKGSVQDLWAEI